MEEHREKQKAESFKTAIYCTYLMCMIIILAVIINIVDNTKTGSSVLIGTAISFIAYLAVEIVKHSVYLYKTRRNKNEGKK